MESKRRVASTVDDNQLYRMESLTPAMMKSKEDDNLDDMMSSDEEEQKISKKGSVLSMKKEQSTNSNFDHLPRDDIPELDLPMEHFKNIVNIGKSSTRPKLEQILE